MECNGAGKVLVHLADGRIVCNRANVLMDHGIIMEQLSLYGCYDFKYVFLRLMEFIEQAFGKTIIARFYTQQMTAFYN